MSEQSVTEHYLIPEAGQLVEARRRQWVVSDVNESQINETSKQHLVFLSSIEEETLGESLKIIWEVEVGARILDKASLPTFTGQDDAKIFHSFLNAIKWGITTNVAKSYLQAPFRSGISIEDYQLDPLVRAIDMTRVNLLIADDVGLGKTIEAGLVAQELVVRHRARSIIIICPSSLQLNWQSEMLEKFGLDFKIVNTEYLKDLRREQGIHVNPWTSYPRLITSMDWVKTGYGLRLLKEILPNHATFPRKFDLLIVDEAHNISPSESKNYSLDSLRTKLIRRLSKHFEHRLFLSATPHNGHEGSFSSLLALLDDQRFARNAPVNQAELQKIMVRRLKSDLVDENGVKIYKDRILHSLNVNYDEEEPIYKLLLEYCQLLQNENAEKGKNGTAFVTMLFKKRFYSSPLAFFLTLKKHSESLHAPAKKTSMIEDRILYKAIAKLDEDHSNDDEFEEDLNDAVELATATQSPPSNELKTKLDKLIKVAEKRKNSPDSKAKKILAWLEQNLMNDGEWTNERVIFFTEYRATHVWMEQILTSHGFGGDRLATLHGGTDQNSREEIKAAFQASPDISPVRILLATDAASEGINLQNHCNFLIHLEIPWNPNVLEQRNGRIDRHGQTKDIHIWHPVGETSEKNSLSDSNLHGDLEFLMVAAKKVNKIRQDLGSVGPVISKQIQEKMSGERRHLDTDQAEAKAKNARKALKLESDLKQRIKKLHDKLFETKEEIGLTAYNIAEMVNSALKLAALPLLEEMKIDGNTVYTTPPLPGSWAKSLENIYHPHTGEKRPVSFDDKLVKNRDDIALLHLNHKFVQLCIRTLKSELWALDDVKKVNRVSFFTSPDVQKLTFITWSRLIITGGGHYKIHEELTYSGGEIVKNNYRRISTQGEVKKIIESSKYLNADTGQFKLASEAYSQNQDKIISTIDARAKERLKTLESTISRKSETEIKDIETNLNTLKKFIEAELSQNVESEQLELFTPEEQTQVKVDQEALKQRLNSIPEELNEEIKNIKNRYRDIQTRIFPVAIQVILPKGGLS